MKIILVFSAFLFACGGVVVQQPKPTTVSTVDGAGSTDTDSNTSTATDTTIGTTSSDAPAQPAKATADDCGENYTAKMVYEDGDQKLYACINKPGSSGAKPSASNVLSPCPYTFEVLSNKRVKLTYTLPKVGETRVASTYTVYPGYLRQTVPLLNGDGSKVCEIEYWDGTTIQYTDEWGGSYSVNP